MLGWYYVPTVKEVFDWQHDKTPIIRKVNMNTKVDPCCGIELICFDELKIEWLLQGKPLYVECCDGEYAHLFLLKLNKEKTHAKI